MPEPGETAPHPKRPSLTFAVVYLIATALAIGLFVAVLSPSAKTVA